MLSAAQFTSIELEDIETYRTYFSCTPKRAADYTFTNLWGWSTHYGLEWKLGHDLCWIRQNCAHKLQPCRLWAPVGDWKKVDWASMPELTPGTEMIRVPEELCQILEEQLPGRVEIEETRGQWEYLYPQTALATLSGTKLHKKKNHVNGYIKAYGEHYVPLSSENMQQVLDLQNDWCKWRECEQSASLLAESDVICSVLREWDRIPGLVGGALLIEDQMVAFSVGEPLDDTTMVVHFEKGRPNFRGVYQAMNCFFAQYAGQGYELLNREQDADEEGLRQAKESYVPCGFIKKNTVRFK